MGYSFKTNYIVLSKSLSFTHHNYKCSMYPPPAVRTTLTR